MRPADLDPRLGRFAIASWLCFRMMGLVALAAFVSLHVQVLGLFGEDGIVPLADRVEAIRSIEGQAWRSPTLLVLTGASDAALHALCLLGELASLAMIANLATGACALFCWLLYLSFVSGGYPFLPLQWDTLLLEALVLVAIAAPWWPLGDGPRRTREPARLARWALWFLAGRLLFASGVVKLASGDPNWSGLTAMSFHYETQPLPNPLSPFMHALPAWMHATSALFVFAAELIAPLLFLAPRKVRHGAVAVSILLQVLIAVTGNYGFFNLLTATLCLGLFDDAALARMLPARLVPAVVGVQPPRAALALRSAGATLMAVLGLTQYALTVGAPVRPEWTAITSIVDPLQLTSPYGLFAVMTTTRDELSVEGTLDDPHTAEPRWVEYPTRYKPDSDPDQGLAVAALHMPRMDWMLWFAALGDRRGASWVLGLQRALLEARQPVLDLFAADPFDGRRPRAVRVTRRSFHLAPPGSRDPWFRGTREPWSPAIE